MEGSTSSFFNECTVTDEITKAPKTEKIGQSKEFIDTLEDEPRVYFDGNKEDRLPIIIEGEEHEKQDTKILIALRRGYTAKEIAEAFQLDENYTKKVIKDREDEEFWYE